MFKYIGIGCCVLFVLITIIVNIYELFYYFNNKKTEWYDDTPYSYPKLLIILDFISIFALIIFLNH